MINKKEKEVEIFYDLISEDYEITHGFRVSDKILELLLLKNLPAGKLKILDAGGGAGRFSKELLKKGHTLVLSDISEGMLSEAKKNIGPKQNIVFVKESIISMKQQKDNSFDVVIFMNAILDYCESHANALNESHRVLKEGGILIGTVNNRFQYCRNHELIDENYDLFRKNMKTGDRYIVWAGQKTGHVTHEFTLSELKKALVDANFKIKKVLGPFNLLTKKEIELLKDKEEFIKLQIEYAQKEEYLNNSQDFFFVARK